MNKKRLFLLPVAALGAALLALGNDEPAPAVADPAAIDRFLSNLSDAQAERARAAEQQAPDMIEIAGKADRHQGLVRGIPAALR